jgi:hypothetical protein
MFAFALKTVVLLSNKFASIRKQFLFYLMCSLRFESNLLTMEGVRFALISKKTPLSKLSFAFVLLALPLLGRSDRKTEVSRMSSVPQTSLVSRHERTKHTPTYRQLPKILIIISTAGNIKIQPPHPWRGLVSPGGGIRLDSYL